MEHRHELEELRARQRRQRRTIESALPAATKVKAVKGGFDTAEIHVRLVAAERLKEHEEALRKLEEEQSREAVHRMAGHRIEHQTGGHWAGKAAERLVQQMYKHDFGGTIAKDDPRVRPLREALLLLQAADAIAAEPDD